VAKSKDTRARTPNLVRSKTGAYGYAKGLDMYTMNWGKRPQGWRAVYDKDPIYERFRGGSPP
jgi:hypothetical protein